MTSDVGENDFTEFEQHLIRMGILPKKSEKSLIEKLRKAHRVCYSLANWESKLCRAKENSRIYLTEMRSDAIQCIPLVLMGYKKPVILLERSIIENCLKHIYFSDHPVEYVRFNREKKFMKIDDLCDNARHHPLLSERLEKQDFVAHLRGIYGRLSMEIHGRTVERMELRKVLKDIRPDMSWTNRFVNDFCKIGGNVNSLLYLFNPMKIPKLGRDIERLILKTMTPKQRRICTRMI